MAEPVAKLMVSASVAVRNGAAEVDSNDLTLLLGWQPRRLEESLQLLLK